MDDKVADLRHWLGVLDKAAKRARVADPERARAISKAEDVLIRRFLLSNDPFSRTSPID
jgi:hypothetical protein